MNRQRHGLRMLTFLALLAAPPAAAQAFDLGGSCEDNGPLPADYYELRRAASRTGDHASIIELEKTYVRAMCSNSYRWLGLASAFLDADRPDQVIAVLQEAHDRGAALEPGSRELHDSRMAAFLDSKRFRDSPLGVELAALAVGASRRRSTHRAQLEALEPAARPSGERIIEGACPFECCSYRAWIVHEDVDLFEAPRSDVRVTSVAAGAVVRGLTGNVYAQPAPVAIVHDHPPFEAGTIVFLLDYIGEGFHRYWDDGATGEVDIQPAERCLRPSRHCWAEYIEPSEERVAPAWWILIETGDGLRGWTDQSGRFGNIDACG